MVVERGYQRGDRRELFGFPDGVRNVPSSQRHDVIFTEVDEQPDEPHWADGGTYLAYLKVHQELDAIAQIPPDELERIIGRRRTDGSRLDLPPGTNARRDEGEFSNPV